MPKKKPLAKIPRKASSAPISLPDTPWDQGAEGPANRIGLVDQERGEVDLATGEVINPNRVFGKVRMPIFMRYQRQGRITEEHAAAAQRLYAAYVGHPTRDPLAAIGERVDFGEATDPNVLAVDRRREFHAMWRKVPAPCKPVIEHVVLNDRPIRAMAGASKLEVAAVFLARLVEGLEAVP